MSKHIFLILGTVGLATGIVFGAAGRPASAAGDGYRLPSSAAFDDVPGARHDSYWEYYGCFYKRCDAENACRELRRDGFQCKIERKNNRWCVYIRRDH
jgi:hypothetical protein